MLNKFTRPKLAAIFLVVLYLTSCNKQEHGVGVGLFSGDNALGAHFVDTFQVKSYSKVLDSVFSAYSGTVDLGFYNDPFFGKTDVSFYTQFEIGNAGVDFGDTLNCDSIVLYLKLGSNDLDYYGKDNSPMRIDVHQISKGASFNVDSSYYSTSSLPLNRESLLDPDFNNLIQPNFFDTVYLSRDSNFTVLQIEGVLALKLDKAFGQRILDQNNTSIMESGENFLEEYQGLYVSIVDEEASDIVFINMQDFGTAVMIYYKAGTDQGDKEYKFIMDDFSAHFNSYRHDYEESGSLQLKSVLVDSTKGDEYFFAQAGGGFKSYISLPTINDLKESQLFIPVNKAELIIPIQPGSTKEYAPPKQLFIFYLNDDGEEEFLPDQYLGTGHIDGLYNAEENQYRFNIIKYIQAVYNGELNANQLVIKTSNGGYTPNRVIFNGSKVDTAAGFLPLRFNLYYSSLIN